MKKFAAIKLTLLFTDGGGWLSQSDFESFFAKALRETGREATRIEIVGNASELMWVVTEIKDTPKISQMAQNPLKNLKPK